MKKTTKRAKNRQPKSAKADLARTVAELRRDLDAHEGRGYPDAAIDGR